MRIAAAAGGTHIDQQLTRYVGDHAGRTLDQSEIDTARFDGDVQRFFDGAAIEQRQRHSPDGGDPDARRLVEAQIDVERGGGVVDATGELLIVDAVDAPVVDRHGSRRGGRFTRASDGDLEVHEAAIPRWLRSRRLQCFQRDARPGHPQRTAAVAPPRSGDIYALSTVAADERGRRDRNRALAPGDRAGGGRLLPPPDRAPDAKRRVGHVHCALRQPQNDGRHDGGAAPFVLLERQVRRHAAPVHGQRAGRFPQRLPKRADEPGAGVNPSAHIAAVGQIHVAVVARIQRHGADPRDADVAAGALAGHVEPGPRSRRIAAGGDASGAIDAEHSAELRQIGAADLVIERRWLSVAERNRPGAPPIERGAGGIHLADRQLRLSKRRLSPGALKRQLPN